MNMLVVGGAGYVGSILRPALEQAHDCRYLDLRPVPEAEKKALELDRPGCHIVQASGDLTDERLLNPGVRELLGGSPQNR